MWKKKNEIRDLIFSSSTDFEELLTSCEIEKVYLVKLCHASMIANLWCITICSHVISSHKSFTKDENKKNLEIEHFQLIKTLNFKIRNWKFTLFLKFLLSIDLIISWWHHQWTFRVISNDVMKKEEESYPKY